jgi:hypothetical protein
MKNKIKKIILFIVEGISDEEALGLSLSKYFNNNQIKFEIVCGDITSNKSSNQQNIKSKIGKIINNVRGDIYKKSDFLKVIHLVDTDGAFIDEERVFEEDVDFTIYEEERIINKSKQSIVERNKRKSSILNKLFTTKRIAGIDYNVYYFSCNLEHVLHNIIQVEENEKIELARSFSDKYDKDIMLFRDFFNSKDFKVEGEYLDTWEFIRKDNNSLKRYSNFYQVFDLYNKE